MKMKSMAELVLCLVMLRTEFNEIAPDRDKESDGWIGDAAHQQELSDHNPDNRGFVHAIDVDKDLKSPIYSMENRVQYLVERHRTGKDNRLNYIIYNRRIWGVFNNWEEREYTGSNPHDKHAHCSAVYNRIKENDTSTWFEDIEESNLVFLPNYGDQGEEVKYWQLLHNLVKDTVTPPAPNIESDGKFGPATKTAFKYMWDKWGGNPAQDLKNLPAWLAVRYHRALVIKNAPSVAVDPEVVADAVNSYFENKAVIVNFGTALEGKIKNEDSK